MANPTTPLRQQVLEALQVKLQAISGNPTYFNTVKSTSVVLDPGKGPNIMTIPSTELPFFIIEPTDAGSKFYMPSLRLREEFQVTITARQDVEGPIHTRNKMQVWERLIADIEVAMTRDITLGGLVVDTRVQIPTPGFDLGATTSIFVVQPVVCRLIRTYGSPWNS